MWTLALLLAIAVADPDAAWERALRADREGDPAALAQACAALIAEAPAHRRAEPCGRHLDRLDARRDASGTLRSLAALEQARRTDAAQADPAVRALWEDAATPTLVRAEAGIWLALRALDADDPDALAITEALVALDPDDPALKGRVTELRAAALVAAGRTDEAAALEAPPSPAVPSLTRAQRIARDQRRARRTRAAGWAAAIGGIALLPGIAGWIGRDRPRPWGLIPLLIAALGGWLVAEAWEPGAGAAVLPFTLGAAVLHLLALGVGRAAPQGTAGPFIRSAAALAALTATLGWGVLCLGWTGSLDWLGL